MDAIVLVLGVLAAYRLWQQFQIGYCLKEVAEFGLCKYRRDAVGVVVLFGVLIIVTLFVLKKKCAWIVSYDVASCIFPKNLAKSSSCHENKASQARSEKELVDSKSGKMEETTAQETVMPAESMSASNTKTGAIAASIEKSSMTPPHVGEQQIRYRKWRRSSSAFSVGFQEQVSCVESVEGTGIQQLSSNGYVRSSRSTSLRRKKSEVPSEINVRSDASNLTIDVDTSHINKTSSVVPDSESHSSSPPLHLLKRSIIHSKTPVGTTTPLSSIDVSPLQSPAFEEEETHQAGDGSESPPRLTSYQDVKHAESSRKRSSTAEAVNEGTGSHAMATCSEREKKPSYHRHKEGSGKNFMVSVFTGPWNAMNRAARGIIRHSKNHRKRSRKAYSDPLVGLKICLDDTSSPDEISMGTHGEAYQKTTSMIGSAEMSGHSLDGFVLGVMTIPICLASFILLMLQTQELPSLQNDAIDAGPLPYMLILLDCALLSSLHQAMSAVMVSLGFGSFYQRVLVIVLAIGGSRQPLLSAWTMAVHQVFLTIMHQVSHFREGELCMMTQAFSLWTVDALLCTIFTTTRSDGWSRVFPVPPQRSIRFFVAQLGLIGLVASRLVLSSLELIWVRWHAWKQRRSATFTRPMSKSSPPSKPLPPIAACIVLIAGMIVTISWWMEVLMQGECPILWITRQVFYSTNSFTRVGLCFYWVLVLALSLPFIPYAVKRFKLRRHVSRKLFHFIALVMFLPAVIFDPEFLSIAIGVALGFMILLEFLPDVMTATVRSYYKLFLDHNDCQDLAVTHIALLFGCALPLWLTDGTGATTCSPFPLNGPSLSSSGILVLGIGDSASALIGSTYGRWRWIKATNHHRTVEGSIAMFISLLMAFALFHEFTTSNIAVNCPGLGFTCPLRLSSLLLPVGTVVILEAFSTELDNIVLPPYAFASLVLLLLS